MGTFVVAYLGGAGIHGAWQLDRDCDKSIFEAMRPNDGYPHKSAESRGGSSGFEFRLTLSIRK